MIAVAGFKIVPDDTLIRAVNDKLELNVPPKISTYDKNAIEEVVRIKEKLGWKAVGITVGNTDRKSVREALSMGLDEVIAVNSGYLDVPGTAEAMAENLRSLSPDLVVLAETTTDSSTSALPPYLAELMGYSLVTYVKSLKVEGKYIVAERSVGSVEVVKAPLPSVVSVTGEINVPRTPSVKQIMESAKKPTKQSSFSSPAKAKLVEVVPLKVNRKKVIIEKPMEEAVEILLNSLKGEGVL